MIVYRKAVLPNDPSVGREMQCFAGTIPHQVLHNKLVDGLNSAREKLEKIESLDEIMRQQGEVRAYIAALAILHENTTPALKESIYV